MPRRLADVLQEKLGTKAIPYINPFGVSQVGVTATRIMQFNPNRFSFELVNLSANTIYVHLDGTVSSSKGIVLGANGGNMVSVWEEDFELVTWEYYALATASGSNILIYEVLSAGAE